MPVYIFTTLNDPLATDGTLAHDINGLGQIVGQYSNNNTGINGFLLSGGTYTTIADPLATQHLTEAFGINDAGQIVGIYVTAPNGDHGFLRNVNTGGVEVYDINNNQITGASFMGTVGLDWQVGGFGNFSSRGTSDMVMRNTWTGGLEVYDIDSNQITGAAFMGTVGLDWQIVGSGDFSSMPGESDLMMRNTNTGAFEVYDIANNQITGATFLGTVGLDWQVAGFGPVSGPGASDMVLRNTKTGAFEVYDIANNQITAAARLGQVGLDWQVGGFAADAPSASSAAMGGASQVGQLVQAMASFGGGSGAADGLNAVALGSDTPQQPLLTTPQHA